MTGLSLKANLKYATTNDEFANLNGLQNLVVADFYKTNADVNSVFNNPENKAELDKHVFIGNVSLEKYLGDHGAFNSNIWFDVSKNNEQVSLKNGVLDFDEGYQNAKSITSKTIGNNSDFKFNNIDLADNLYLDTSFSLQSKYSSLDYHFLDSFSPNNNSMGLDKTTISGITSLMLDSDLFDEMQMILSLNNTSFLSTFQQNEFWVPSANFHITLSDLIYEYDLIGYWGLNISYGETITESDLLYTNYSHNSTLLSANEINDYTNRIDLFATQNLALERGKNFEISTEIEAFRRNFTLGFSFEKVQTEGAIFPVATATTFSLENAANTTTQIYDLSLKGRVRVFDEVQILPFINFYKYKNQVDELHIEDDKLLVAGFKDIGNALIEGEPAGVLVGSAFRRDAAGNIERHKNGIPIKAESLIIIGDPTPNYNLKFGTDIEYDKFLLSANFTYQDGGDLWNGTQQFIQQEDTSSFIAESAIEDATSINFNRCSLNYSWYDSHDASSLRGLIKSFNVAIFANNIYNWGKATGTTPNATFLDQQSAKGLQFFNLPQQTEIGITLTAKI